MRFVKPSARKVAPSQTSTGVTNTHTSIETAPVRWSDVAANRKSTHPDLAPIKRIIDTYELCGGVLQLLPLKDILRMKRVCRTFNSIINSSAIIQTKLFQKPTSVTPSWVFDSDGVLLTSNEASEYIRKNQAAGCSSNSVRLYAVNSLLLSLVDTSTLETRIGDDSSYTTYYGSPILNISIKRRLRSMPQQASHCSMYLSQPPTTKVRISIEGRKDFMLWEDRRGLPKWFHGTVASPTPSRMTEA